MNSTLWLKQFFLTRDRLDEAEARTPQLEAANEPQFSFMGELVL